MTQFSKPQTDLQNVLDSEIKLVTILRFCATLVELLTLLREWHFRELRSSCNYTGLAKKKLDETSTSTPKFPENTKPLLICVMLF